MKDIKLREKVMKIYEFNECVVINATPHGITMQDTDSKVIQVDSSCVINATAETVKISSVLCKTKFIADDNTLQFLKELHDTYDGEKPLMVVGSMIAAQAYPGLVVAMTPVPGFERRPPAEKRMRADMFVTYA